MARLESTAGDAKVSTVDRYAETLGYVVQYHLIPPASTFGVRILQLGSRSGCDVALHVGHAHAAGG